MSSSDGISAEEESHEVILGVKRGPRAEFGSLRISTNVSVPEQKLGVKCSICLSNMEHPFKLNWGNTYCKECIIAHWEQKIKSKEKLTCPNCWADISYLIDRGILSEEVKKKYQEFERQMKVDRDPHLHWWPRLDCDKYVYQVPRLKNKKEQATCECGFNFCILCREEWHPTKTCNKVKDKGYLQFLKQPQVKRCPHCKSTIQKIDGCNHMTCNVCKYEFCWVWGKIYTSDHLNGMTACSYEGKTGYEIIFIMLLLPLIMIVLAFALTFEWAKAIKGDCGWWPMGCILYTIAFLLALPLGILLQIFVPFLFCFFMVMWIKLLIKKCSYRN